MVEYCKLLQTIGGDVMYGEDAYEAMGPVPTLAPGEQLLW